MSAATVDNYNIQQGSGLALQDPNGDPDRPGPSEPNDSGDGIPPAIDTPFVQDPEDDFQDVTPPPPYENVLDLDFELPAGEQPLEHFLKIRRVERVPPNQRGYDKVRIYCRIENVEDSLCPELMMERVFHRAQEIAYKDKQPLKTGYALYFPNGQILRISFGPPDHNSAYACANQMIRLEQSERQVELFGTDIVIEVTFIFNQAASGCVHDFGGAISKNFIDIVSTTDGYCLPRSILVGMLFKKDPNMLHRYIVSFWCF